MNASVVYTSLQGQQKIDILKKIKQQSLIIDFGLARGFELAGGSGLI